MKNTIILAIFLCLFCILARSNHQKPLFSADANKVDTPNVERTLVKFKYQKYIDKPIGHLLKDIKLEYKEILFVQMKPLYLAFVTIIYSDELRLDIYTEKYELLKRELTTEKESGQFWKIEDLLKEKVTKVRVRDRFGKSLREYPKKPKIPVI
jgi:hypothetical protein